MCDIRDGLYYTPREEWVSIERSNARVGITDPSQQSMGRIVSVELPKVGDKIRMGDKIGKIKNMRYECEIIAPISGTVIDVNKVTDDEISNSPYDDGWLFLIRMHNPSELNNLMDSSEYKIRM